MERLKLSAEDKIKAKEAEETVHGKRVGKMAVEVSDMAEGNEKLSNASRKKIKKYDFGTNADWQPEVAELPPAYDEERKLHSGNIVDLQREIHLLGEKASQLEQAIKQYKESAAPEVIQEAEAELAKLRESILTKETELQKQTNQKSAKDKKSGENWRRFSDEQKTAGADPHKFATETVLGFQNFAGSQRPVGEGELHEAVKQESSKRGKEAQEKYEQKIEKMQEEALKKAAEDLEKAFSVLNIECDAWIAKLKGEGAEGEKFVEDYQALYRRYNGLLGKKYWFGKEEKEKRDREELNRLMKEMETARDIMGSGIIGSGIIGKVREDFSQALRYAWGGEGIIIPHKGVPAEGAPETRGNLAGRMDNIASWLYSDKERKQRMSDMVLRLEKKAHDLQREIENKLEIIRQLIKEKLPDPR